MKIQNFPKKAFVIAGAGLILIALWFSARSTGNQNIVEESQNTLVQQTPMSQMENDDNAMSPAQQEAARQTINQALQDPDTKTSELKDVSGGRAGGTAFRLYNTRFYLKLDLVSLILPEKGFYYEGWLVNPAGNYFSIGAVVPQAEGGVLYYQSDEDKSGYTKIVVSLEPENNVPAPAEHILEGEF